MKNPANFAFRRCEGFALFDPMSGEVTFSLHRYGFDPRKPTEADQFAGFPITLKTPLDSR